MKQFRAFILRGNVVDLAVGLVVGAAFGTVVSSLVSDILTPFLGLLNLPDFTMAAAKVGSAQVRYGLFLNSLISFVTISVAVFFFVVRPVNSLMDRMKTEPEVESPTRECPYCLSRVPARASRCAFCTSDLTKKSR
jgi:large conductance mechanosensitive channel